MAIVHNPLKTQPRRVRHARIRSAGQDVDAIVGDARAAAQRFLGSGTLQTAGFTEHIRAHVHSRENRKRYVAQAEAYLRAKVPTPGHLYDVVLVGAGIHAAMFLYTVRKVMPELSALIVEKSTDICSTFATLGDSLILNSPTSARVGLNSNIAPGHFVQVSDFDELADRPFPTAKHLHELTTMVLFHADADIRFGFGVDAVTPTSGGYSVVSRDGDAVHARSVVISNGMGEPRSASFAQDARSDRVVTGDDFIARCYQDDAFLEGLRDKTVGVVGAGDTANCVMEYLLPLTYPHRRYDSHRTASLLPAMVYWIGQEAATIQDFYFANKQRYCHSGGIIEFFWRGDTPFDLSVETWNRTKSRIQCVPERLTRLAHSGDGLELMVGSASLAADIAIDCTGRVNALSDTLLEQDYEFIEGDVVLHGGRWVEALERFDASPRPLPARRIACKLSREKIFLLGSACPLGQLVEDEEARDGSLRFEESRTSLTNSKWSLEHTLPRSVAFAEQFARHLAPSAG